MIHQILIIEDEQPAVKRLKSLITNNLTKVNFVNTIDSIKESIAWLAQNPAPDLIFMDIQLADGQSFDIFAKATITSPVIFITAYNDFAIKAFDVNGLDYLLKPINETRFAKAIHKYLHQKPVEKPNYAKIIQELQTTTNFKSRFLVKQGEQFVVVPIEKVAYFQFLDGYTHLFTFDGKKVLLDESIDATSQQINPQIFFQVNRKTIINIQAIKKISSWFNSRLKVELNPQSPEEVIVSRNRVKEFKDFLAQ